MEEGHLRAALRYVVLNPVRAGLCDVAEAWPWSSIHAWLGRNDAITRSEPVLARYPDVRAMLRSGNDDAAFEQLRQAEAVGRPLGSESFLSTLEVSSGRRLKPHPTGRPRKQA
jgi:putative transposase